MTVQICLLITAMCVVNYDLSLILRYFIIDIPTYYTKISKDLYNVSHILFIIKQSFDLPGYIFLPKLNSNFYLDLIIIYF